MSKSLQWVIGIGVVLVVAALVFSSVAPFFLPRLGAAGAPLRAGPRGPFLPGLPFRLGLLGVRRPFFGLFGLLGWVCLGPLLLAGLIVLAISSLARRPAPPAPMASVAPAPPVTPPNQAVCPNCGQPLQPGWRHCPNCGQPLAQ